MGTRGLLGFIIAGRRRASYNQFDSYPSGLGAQVAKFILGLKEGEKRAMLEHVHNQVGAMKLGGTHNSHPNEAYLLPLFCSRFVLHFDYCTLLTLST